MNGTTNIESPIKMNQDLNIAINGTVQVSYNGETFRYLDISLATLGAAASTHNHDDIYSRLDHKHTSLLAPDYREIPTVPSDYNNALVSVGLKYRNVMGLPSTPNIYSYAGVLGYRPWADQSGGNAFEIALLNDNQIWVRSADNDTTWNNPWVMISCLGSTAVTTRSVSPVGAAVWAY